MNSGCNFDFDPARSTTVDRCGKFAHMQSMRVSMPAQAPSVQAPPLEGGAFADFGLRSPAPKSKSRLLVFYSFTLLFIAFCSTTARFGSKLLTTRTSKANWANLRRHRAVDPSENSGRSNTGAACRLVVGFKISSFPSIFD